MDRLSPSCQLLRDTKFEEKAQREKEGSIVDPVSNKYVSKMYNSCYTYSSNTCRVCGDYACVYNFGGLSCEGCKAFFRRSVRKTAYLAYECEHLRRCDITKNSRSRCQFCRFQKCLSIGMNVCRVRTAERSLLLLQERLEKKRMDDFLQTLAQSAPLELQDPKQPLIQDRRCEMTMGKILKRMTHADQKEIRLVLHNYSKAAKEIPFRASLSLSLSESPKTNLEIVDMFTTLLRRLTYFSTLFPEFAALSKVDQCNQLRSAILKMCLLRGAAFLDNENIRVSNSSTGIENMSPWSDEFTRLGFKEIFEIAMDLMIQLKSYGIDEPIAMLLVMILLLSPAGGSVDGQRERVKISQVKYDLLLKNYISCKFGIATGHMQYLKLLSKLDDLQELNQWSEFPLNLDVEEANLLRRAFIVPLQHTPHQDIIE